MEFVKLYASWVALRGLWVYHSGERRGNMDQIRIGRFIAQCRKTGGLTQRQLLTACARQHERFLREMEENKDRIRLCRTGEEIDRAAADGELHHHSENEAV